MPSDYKSFSERIEKATTLEGVRALTKSLDRLYNAGIFTGKEFCRLDIKIIHRCNELERAPQ